MTSYKAPHEVLAIRKDAAFDGSKPIAGGLQICWPQFGAGAIQQVREEESPDPGNTSIASPTAPRTVPAPHYCITIYIQNFLQHPLRSVHLSRLTGHHTLVASFGPQHGFARNLPWELEKTEGPEVTLSLKASDATKKIWDEAFEAYLTVHLAADHLMTKLHVKNTGSKPWSFTGEWQSTTWGTLKGRSAVVLT